VLIAFDYRASGIWQVSTKEDTEAPSYKEWSSLARAQHRQGGAATRRPWGDLLSDQILDDLKAWNDSWDFTIVQEDEEIVEDEVLKERGRALAIRVQNELGTDGWEVLYHMGGRVHRVHPSASWPEETWMQDLLGYSRPDPHEIAEEEARTLEGLREHQDGSPTPP
jgi:hypothetical protein